MLDRLKWALRESYVGAIALGWMLAEDVTQLVNIFATPVQEWAARKEYTHLTASAGAASGLPFEFALPGLVRFLLILVIWYALVRWLYFGPANEQATAPRKEMV